MALRRHDVLLLTGSRDGNQTGKTSINARLNERLRTQRLVELSLGHQLTAKHHFSDSRTLRMGFGRNGRRVLLADVWVQCRGECEGALHCLA